MSDSDSNSDDDIDYDNLTEEIQFLNEKMESNKSEDLNLDSSDESIDDSYKLEIAEELKNYSDYKFKSLKKSDLLAYLEKLIDIDELNR